MKQTFQKNLSMIEKNTLKKKSFSIISDDIDWKKIPNKILSYECNLLINSDNSIIEENYNKNRKIIIQKFSLMIYKKITFLIEKQVNNDNHSLYLINNCFKKYFIMKYNSLEINSIEIISNLYNEIDVFIDFFGALIYLFYRIRENIKNNIQLKHLFSPFNFNNFSSYLGLILFLKFM